MFLNYEEKISRRLIGYKKKLLFVLRKPCDNTLPVFIMGCGRSGTTMLLNAFHRDDRVEALGENDPKISLNYMLMTDKLALAIKYCKAPVLISKPILNSFDALMALKSYERAKIIWLLRDYKDMIASSIKMFGPVASGYMKNLVLFKKGDNWLSAGMPTETLEILSKLDSTAFTDYDWMGLLWWSVNRTIMIDRLYESERLLLLKYEALVGDPNAVFRQVYEYIGLQYNNRASKYVYASSVGRGAAIQLHAHVQEMCNNLAAEVNAIIRKTDMATIH